jgi:hypothetical protein
MLTIPKWRPSRRRRPLAAFAVGQLLALCLAFSAQAPAFAGPLEDAKAASDKGDYPTALAIVTPLAEQGNADAQLALGWMYFNGRPPPKDTPQALKWWGKAADQDNASAQNLMGREFEFGWGGNPIDMGEAANWYLRAANLANHTAEHQLAMMYKDGRGVPQDLVQAYAWQYVYINAFRGDGTLRDLAPLMTAQQLSQARQAAINVFLARAARGDARAEDNLGANYLDDRDFAQSTAWYRKAAERGDYDGEFWLGNAYQQGLGVPIDPIEAYKWMTVSIRNAPEAAKTMTAEQVAEGERRAAAWKPVR